MKILASILAAITLTSAALGVVLAEPPTQVQPAQSKTDSLTVKQKAQSDDIGQQRDDETSTTTTNPARPQVWNHNEPFHGVVDQSKGKYSMFLPDGTPVRSTATTTQKGTQPSPSTSTTTATTSR